MAVSLIELRENDDNFPSNDGPEFSEDIRARG